MALLCLPRPSLRPHGFYPPEISGLHVVPAAGSISVRRPPQHCRHISAKASEYNTPSGGRDTHLARVSSGTRDLRQKPHPAENVRTSKTNGRRKNESTAVQNHLQWRKATRSLEVLNALISTKSLWDSDNKLLLPSILLRDCCRCDQCIDPSTKQRLFSFHDIPGNVRALQGGTTDDGRFVVSWENDIHGFVGHTSYFSLVELKAIIAQAGSRDPILRNEPPEQWNRKSITEKLLKMSYKNYMNNNKDLFTFTKALQRDGLVFLKEVPSSAESVHRIVERIGPVRNTFYGSTWDVKSKPEAENVAYTDQKLEFHMDLLYMTRPPKYQFLHCLQNNCIGGESQFLDVLRARKIMTDKDPEQARTLESVKFRYHYENKGHSYMNVKQVFGHRFRHVFWSPPFVDSITAESEMFDNMLAALSAVKAFASILKREDLVYETKMEGGTCVIFDNLRVVHARNAFDANSGHRWLRGAYLDGQPLLSTHARLIRQEAASRDREFETWFGDSCVR